jgi:hypothetical protein
MSDQKQALERLRIEFEADRDTFLSRLRIDTVWDDEAFARLVDALRDGYEVLKEETMISRWVAQHNWFAPTFV